MWTISIFLFSLLLLIEYEDSGRWFSKIGFFYPCFRNYSYNISLYSWKHRINLKLGIQQRWADDFWEVSTCSSISWWQPRCSPRSMTGRLIHKKVERPLTTNTTVFWIVLLLISTDVYWLVLSLAQFSFALLRKGLRLPAEWIWEYVGYGVRVVLRNVTDTANYLSTSIFPFFI